MILTCPSCTTRYFADGANLGPKGRNVRCAACGHTWHASAEDEPALELTVETAPDPLGDFTAPGEVAAPPAAKPHQAIRQKAARRKRQARTRAAALAWGVVGALFLGVAAAAYAFRVEVVSLWPRAASAYALAGVEAKARALVFEHVTAERLFEAGEPVLSISAIVRNPTGRVRAAPPVRVSLRDRAGAEVSAWVVELDVAELGPHGETSFSTRVAQPPADAEDLELRFVDAEEVDEGEDAEPESGRTTPEPEHGEETGEADAHG